ncbi:glycosyltransferase N-terminal domain-containing protein [Alisedimentitalea sp. MJ-SS2]|uniref:3-deoxy-D-manno-octulosonic acid transferase n=1 Tax=Aliisedimentitalea sp. MJ-SS2 TaxID=3049795 RepID=UPI002913A114|nr:glycosyltransferase N-terminal domain-containing protein [Alisedimentitalea sp. MJ-SS2]MDU8929287.1 glycosyltransferase N-terminal domain-containing protein [Alisedimentitalea sp. MJ-SS2]
MRSPEIALRAWLGLTWVLQPILPWHLKRRIKRGKEDATRWREKLGHASAERPEGRLIWMHAVGLGEVLALRGLIARLSEQDPDLNFLVTSGTLASAQVFARNLPPRTIHQFAPLDAPGPARRFLDHWRPDLSIWAEQELWPGLVFRTDRANIPLALVNARMNTTAFERRRRGGAIYRDILPRFALISAQDDLTAEHLAALGAPLVSTDGSLKPVTPPLADAPKERADLQAAIKGRFCWLAASSHDPDESLALATHEALLKANPDALLILAPRLPDRAPEIMTRLAELGLETAQRSKGQDIPQDTQVYLADTFGDLGLLYRLAQAAFIGGTTSDIEGHNPWEAAQLGCTILHGPRTANFAADYAALTVADAARLAGTPDKLVTALQDPSLADTATRASTLVAANMDRLDHLCQKLRELL